MEQVLTRVREVARQRGLDPELVGRIYEPMVGAFVEVERDERASPGRGGSPQRPARREDRGRRSLDAIWDEGPEDLA